MGKVHQNLVVIRSENIKKSVMFYQRLGLSFSKHQHSHGAEHFASEMGSVVFEIDPTRSGSASTTATRLGFQVPSVDSLVCELEKDGTAIAPM